MDSTTITYFVLDAGTILLTTDDFGYAEDTWQRRREMYKPEHRSNVTMFEAVKVR